MIRAELLESALKAVNERPTAYGPPGDNFKRIAALWNEYVMGRYGQPYTDHNTYEVKFDATDVAAMMILMKVARLEESPAHLDSWVDIAGYAACGAEVCAPVDSPRERG